MKNTLLLLYDRIRAILSYFCVLYQTKFIREVSLSFIHKLKLPFRKGKFMLEGYKILTVTHRDIHVKEISNYVLQVTDFEAGSEKLRALMKSFSIDEIMYVATCNRVMYFFYTEKELDKNFSFRFFQQVNPKLTPNDLFLLPKKIKYFTGKKALNHLNEVAASVDSLVVGEREILRQLRESYETSRVAGLTGDKIRLAMQSAVAGAKKVYGETRIGEKPVSIVSLAIKEMMKMNLPEDARILMIGAGQTNRLVSNFLIKYQFRDVTVYNRTLENAAQLAATMSGRADTLDNLPNHKGGFDCLIVCTASTEAVVNADLYGKLLNGETDKKIVIDLSIPYNVDKDVFEKYDAHHIEIDGLRALAKENLSFRQKEVTIAKDMLVQNLNEFHVIFQERKLALAMRHVPTEIKAIKAHAMNTVFRKKMDLLDDESRAIVEEMMTYMEKRCISIPMQAAKEAFS